MGSSADILQKRILVLAPIGNDAPLTVRLLNAAGLAAEATRDIHDLTACIAKGCGAIMVAEEALGPQSMRELVTALQGQPSWSDIPIILITGRDGPATSTVERLTLFGPAGIVTLIERPFQPSTITNAAQVALRSRLRQYEVRDLLLERNTLLASLEERVALRTRELRESNMQLEEMIYTIAHDLRAPLRAVCGYTNMLAGENDLSEDSRAIAQRAARAAGSMDTLILELLEYGRVARAELVLEPVPLEAAVANALTQCEAAIQESSAAVDIQRPLPTVHGHVGMLTQVVANLLNNALKFVPEGRAPRVNIGAERQNGTVHLWIRDNGIGIAPEHHARIFRVFERLEARRYKGTGIGLAIVNRAIERMGGSIALQSEPGKGSTFTISLPAPSAEG